MNKLSIPINIFKYIIYMIKQVLGTLLLDLIYLVLVFILY